MIFGWYKTADTPFFLGGGEEDKYGGAQLILEGCGAMRHHNGQSSLSSNALLMAAAVMWMQEKQSTLARCQLSLIRIHIVHEHL